MAKKQFIEISYDFKVWGINSSIEDYRLCQFLNHHLNWQLKRVEDIEFYSSQIKGVKHFNAYKYTNDRDYYTVELIQNKNSGNTLIPELKNIDYLFLMKGEDDYFDLDTFIKSLSETNGVQSVLPIELSLLKSKNNLLIRHFNEFN